MSIHRANLPAVVGSALPLPAPPPSDEEHASPGMSMAQVTSILRAHLRRSLIMFFVLVVVFAAFIKMLPHSYVATATLIVNHGDKNPLAGPDFAAGFDNTFIPTQIELIQSPAVLQPVIDQLRLLSNKEWAGNGDFKGPQAALREAIFTRLADSLNVSQGTGSDLLYIAASAKDPMEAATLANAVADQYLLLNRQRIDEPATQSAELYTKELEDLREKTIQAQEQVTAFRQKNGMIDLAPANGNEAETALSDLEEKLLAAENQERNVQAQLQAQAWGISSATAPGSGELAGKLSADEAQLAKLRETLGPRHPEVLELESQMASIKRAIAADLNSQLDDARKLVAQYSAAVHDQKTRALGQRQVQDQGAKLLLELESAEATYKRALDGYPQIQFAANDAANDVVLVSRAVPPAKALKPNKSKYFLIACAAALALAFGIPFGYELFLNRRLRCRDDLERNFGVAVLAQFGPIEP